ncbi:hypothetical protein [Myceligenerans crystallogenes]|uniref:Peptidase n=1 Tax=Myceligenerans crystallogenes TaxID=316335 RepID=A0ABN2N7J1_9MICO
MRRSHAVRLASITATAIATIAVATTTALGPVAQAGEAAAGSAASSGTAAARDTAIDSTVAPVLRNGRVHTYSARQMERVEAQGGDPEVLAYWTPERMAEAKPIDEPGDRELVGRQARALANQLALAATAEPVSTYSAPVAPQGVRPMARRTLPINTGKLFIGGFESGSWCSAAAINTGSKRVLITAGHCVHEGPGGTWHRNLVFVPMYRGHADYRAPYGKFQVATMHAFQGWTRSGYFSRDVAFASTYRNDRDQRLVGAVGGNGLTTGGSYRFTATIFGYPYNLDDGLRMQRCRKEVHRHGDRRTSLASGCGYGQGSSGGPWLWHYSSERGTGYARGVTSYGPRSGFSYIASPHFDSAVRDLAAAANRAF